MPPDNVYVVHALASRRAGVLALVCLLSAGGALGERMGHAQANPAGRPPAPTEAELGFPIYPNATFLTSYDAGRGQRYYLFGTETGFEEMVRYYAVVLDERGDTVFRSPPVHVFEIGRFREETMAFPPGVTIKDYTWNGSPGYLDPNPGSLDRYATVIQIVPPPAGQAER